MLAPIAIETRRAIADEASATFNAIRNERPGFQAERPVFHPHDPGPDRRGAVRTARTWATCPQPAPILPASGIHGPPLGHDEIFGALMLDWQCGPWRANRSVQPSGAGSGVIAAICNGANARSRAALKKR